MCFDKKKTLLAALTLMHFHSAQLNEFDSVASMFVWRQKIGFHYFPPTVEPMHGPKKIKFKKMHIK